MRHRITHMKPWAAFLVLVMGALAQPSTPALAQEQRWQDGRAHSTSGVQLDQRYRHDHYYPPRGYVAASLPSGSIGVKFAGGQYFFHGGVWFRPASGRFVVIAPPVGNVVPVLPPAYVALSIGGAPYYYANAVYYAPMPGGQGYTVVSPPPGGELAQPMPPVATAPSAPPPTPIIYPRNGQSSAQTETDRQACYGWASAQPGAAGDEAVFERAVDACMDGRGYTLR